jgi:S1-C subfamily serine protease
MKSHVFAACFLLFVSWMTASGQKMVTMSLDADKDFLLQEVGVIVHGSHDSLIVTDVMNGNPRIEKNKGVDIRTGDIVSMVNGVRPAGVKGLHKAYDECPIGGEFKLGIRRDGAPVLVTVIKSEPPSGGNVKMMKMTMNGSDMKILPGLGILEEKNKSLSIKETLPVPEGAPQSPLKPGDVIKAINGTAIGSYNQAQKLYKEIKPGTRVDLTIVRAGKEMKFAVPKPEGMQRVIIKH